MTVQWSVELMRSFGFIPQNMPENFCPTGIGKVVLREMSQIGSCISHVESELADLFWVSTPSICPKWNQWRTSLVFRLLRHTRFYWSYLSISENTVWVSPVAAIDLPEFSSFSCMHWTVSLRCISANWQKTLSELVLNFEIKMHTTVLANLSVSSRRSSQAEQERLTWKWSVGGPIRFNGITNHQRALFTKYLLKRADFKRSINLHRLLIQSKPGS